MTLRYSPSTNTPHNRHRSCNDRGSIAITMYRKGKLGNKKEYFRKLAVLYQLSLQVRWRQGEYRHMGCTARSQLAFEVLVAHSTSERLHLFLIRNVVTDFLKCKSREQPFNCTKKTSAIVFEVEANRLVPLLTPLFSGWKYLPVVTLLPTDVLVVPSANLLSLSLHCKKRLSVLNWLIKHRRLCVQEGKAYRQIPLSTPPPFSRLDSGQYL